MTTHTKTELNPIKHNFLSVTSTQIKIQKSITVILHFVGIKVNHH